MLARAAVGALVSLSILAVVPLPSSADTSTPSTLDQPAQAIVPDGWAGIWQVVAETRDCTSGAVVGTASYLDTLCIGGDFFLLPGQSLTRGGYEYASCNGPGFTDTTLALTCSIGGICGCFGTCSYTQTVAAQWTRNGDVATTVVTQTLQYFSSPGCAPPNSCRRTTATRTRIASPACAHTILATAGPNGSISPSGSVSVHSGGTQSFTITPDAGYVIASVLVDSTEVGPVTSYTFTHITRNHTIAASFSAPTILASAGPHGSIDPSGTVTPIGGTQTFTITPDPGYVIGSVVVDGVDVGRVASYTFTDVTTPHTIAANFALLMGFEFKPHRLHLNLNEQYVTGYLTPPVGFAMLQIDVASIRLNGSVPIAPGTDATIVSTALKVKFLRSALAPTLTVGSDVTVTVSGDVAGEPFVGTDVIDVSAPKVVLAGATVTAGTTTDVQWDVPGASTPTVTLLSTFDGGSNWNVEAEGIPNTGRYTWLVPEVTTDAARLAVIQIFATDETGIITESEWAVSDPFSISSPLGVGEPRVTFALRPANPVAGPLMVRFSLATESPATLTVYDVGGRQAAAREVGGAAGWHTVTFGRLPAGVYVVRLTQAGRSLSAPVVVVR